MTDLEITRLCAEAMGFEWSRPKFQSHSQVWISDGDSDKWKLFDPLHDDVQAMALVKKIGLDIHCSADMNGWYVMCNRLREAFFINEDLNRAICECVAEMQSAKASA